MKYFIISLLIFTLAISCNKKDNASTKTATESHASEDGHDHEDGHDEGNELHEHEEEEDDHDGEDGHEDHDDEAGGGHEEEEGVHLTKEQVELVDLKIGSFSDIKVTDFVKATGRMGLPPDTFASVNAKIDGLIAVNKKFVEGDYIKKGTTIATIENIALLEKQQDYLEAYAQLNFLNQEVNRQQGLTNENAGIEKNLQKAISDRSVLNAKLKGTENYLSFLGVSIDQLKQGNIQNRITITAPMSGYISKVDFQHGMYVEPTMKLMEIINDSHVHLELDVFENNVGQIEVGQEIEYTVPALGNEIYKGEVDVIGKEYDIESKTIRVHGHVEKIKPKFINNLFINAKIWLNNDSSKALPSEAIIDDGNEAFIYVTSNKLTDDEIEFERISILKGAQDGDYVSVNLLSPLKENQQIVTKGAYYIQAQEKAGELSHSH